MIGLSIPKYDSKSKATGAEKYASDYYPENLLWIGVKRSDHPHAKLININIIEAEKVKGIKKILTFKDIKGTNRVGVPEFDQPVLCDDKVRHLGDPVALIIGEKKENINRAIELIKVDYEVLEPVSDPEKALRPDSPLVHENLKEGNILLKGSVEKGLGKEAFKECDYIHKYSLSLPIQEHSYLETECGVAWKNPDGNLTIIASTQTPFRDLREIANALGLKPENVRVIAPYLGGGFGGKDGITIQGLLGLAALHSNNRPVKIFNSREESFISSTKRHPAKLFYEVGCKKDGTLHALNSSLIFDTGPYSCLGPAVLALAIEHTGGIYKFPNAFAEGFCVYTNNPIGGAFRGFGVPQVIAAIEQIMDDLAEKFNIDRIEFRLKNALHGNDKNSCGVTMQNSIGNIECLKKVQEHDFWKEKEKWISQTPKFKKRGVGVASALHGMGYGPVVPDTATAKIELLPDGRFKVFAGVTDMGQGNASTFHQIAASILNQEITEMELITPDTYQTLPSGSSSASRTTFTYGNALIQAVINLRRIIFKKAAEILKIDYFQDKFEHEFSIQNSFVIHNVTDRKIPLKEIAENLKTDERIITHTYTAQISSDVINCSKELRNWGVPHRIFSFATHLAYIEVDELTGEVEVCKYLAVTDAGKIINPQIYEQQVHGGICQGIGYVLYEDFKVNECTIKTRNFSTYIIPTSMDVPDFTSLTIIKEDNEGPFGMKGVGEIVIDPVYPAIANAIYNALKIRISNGPISAEKILSAQNKNN